MGRPLGSKNKSKIEEIKPPIENGVIERPNMIPVPGVKVVQAHVPIVGDTRILCKECDHERSTHYGPTVDSRDWCNLQGCICQYWKEPEKK